MADGLRNSRPFVAAYVAANERFLGTVADMLRFLGTAEGRPTLNAQGRLDFQTQRALDSFQIVAGRVDDARAALLQTSQALADHQQRSLRGLQSLGR
jgi:hypothetical protein